MNDELAYKLRTQGRLLKQKQRYRLLDAFSGAGGMTLGFSERFGHVFESVWANDFNKDAVESYNINFARGKSHCVLGDIVSILEDPKVRIPKADVVVGGVPCQGHSLLNKNRDGDPRNQLWRPFMTLVERSKASCFVIENVPQILDSQEYGEIVEHARMLGFQIASARLCAADYGVPQTRWRAFIIGCRFADPATVFPPARTHRSSDPNQRGLFRVSGRYVEEPEPWVTVKDAIGDLPPPIGQEIRAVPPPMDIHFGRTPTAMSLKRYKAVPLGGNRFDLQRNAPDITPKCWIRKTSGGTDLFGRLWWDRPSITIRTEFYKPEKGRYLHPDQHRPITHREAARIQSFPDDFAFSGTKIEVARQIGNAVPPMLAARVADCIYALLASRK